MAELSIKVSIANRVYPLKINDTEEENIRKAAKLINEKVKEYEDNFAVRDKQDLLAMSALHYASESLTKAGKTLSGDPGHDEQLSELDHLITAYLTEAAPEKAAK